MQQKKHPIFIGYASLEQLVEMHEPEMPFYVLATASTACDVGPVGLRAWYLSVQDVDAEGNVRYWRTLVGKIQTVNGQPFHEREEESRWQRAKSGVAIIRSYLRSKGYSIHDAVIAYPQDLRYLDGRTDIMKYDKEQDRFLACADVPSVH